MNKKLTIAHITDIHTGSQYFITNLMTRVVAEINELKPEALVVTGDLTTMGFRPEFTTAKSFIDQIRVANKVVIPGNHDSRNVGYIHFEELFGPRFSALHLDGISIIALDSSVPDLNSGHIGRERYGWLKEQFASAKGIRIFAMHHHLLPVPGTGRERNIVHDAGDLLEVLLDCDVDLSIHGHKHVPWAWRFENLVTATAATCSTLRLRGNIKPSYNIYEVNQNTISIYRKYPYGEKVLIAVFEKHDGDLKKYLKWRQVKLKKLIDKGTEANSD